MNTIKTTLACLTALLLTGCYAGSQFTIEASHLDQPVSLSPTIHNNKLEVLKAGEYEEIGRFSISFSGWSLGSPLSPNPKRDISDVLNQIVKEKGGNGITHLTIQAANNPVNFVSMVLKGVSWFGVVLGTAILLSSNPNKTVPIEMIGVSAAGILFLPTVGDFTVEGMVVKIKQPEAWK